MIGPQKCMGKLEIYSNFVAIYKFQLKIRESVRRTILSNLTIYA